MPNCPNCGSYEGSPEDCPECGHSSDKQVEDIWEDYEPSPPYYEFL